MGKYILANTIFLGESSNITDISRTKGLYNFISTVISACKTGLTKNKVYLDKKIRSGVF